MCIFIYLCLYVCSILYMQIYIHVCLLYAYIISVVHAHIYIHIYVTVNITFYKWSWEFRCALLSMWIFFKFTKGNQFLHVFFFKWTFHGNSLWYYTSDQVKTNIFFIAAHENMNSRNSQTRGKCSRCEYAGSKVCSIMYPEVKCDVDIETVFALRELKLH